MRSESQTIFLPPKTEARTHKHLPSSGGGNSGLADTRLRRTPDPPRRLTREQCQSQNTYSRSAGRPDAGYAYPYKPDTGITRLYLGTRAVEVVAGAIPEIAREEHREPGRAPRQAAVPDRRVLLAKSRLKRGRANSGRTAPPCAHCDWHAAWQIAWLPYAARRAHHCIRGNSCRLSPGRYPNQRGRN